LKNGRCKDLKKRGFNGKFHNKGPLGKPRRRWDDVIRRDKSQILGIRKWRRRAEDREEWSRLMRKARAQKGLRRHRWTDELQDRRIVVRFQAQTRDFLLPLLKKSTLTLGPKHPPT